MPAPIETKRVRANGITFEVDEAGAGDAVALLLHGFPESKFSWRHQIPPLAAAGWKVVAPNMRGYGDTGRPTGIEPYKLPHLVADAAALFTAYGARKRLLVAHDWGGVIAWQFAMHQPLPLDGLIVMNGPHPGRMRDLLKHGWGQRMRSWYVQFFQLPKLPELQLTARNAAAVATAIRGTAVQKDRFPDEVMARYRADAVKPGAMTAMLNYYRANYRSLMNPPDPLPRIGTPTLVIWGEQDSALVPEQADGLEPYVEDLTVVRIADASHWVQQDAPDEVNRAIAGWLGERGITPQG